MTARLITTPQDLRPGDMFLGPIGGLVGFGVGLGLDILGEAFQAGTLSIRHAGIIVEAAQTRVLSVYDGATYPGQVETLKPPMLAQAMPRGAEIVPLSLEHHWTERCAYVRLPEDYPGQAEDAAAVARLMVREGVGYSFLSYPALAAYKVGIRNARLRGWINRRRELVWINRRREPIPFEGAGTFVQNGTTGMISLPREAICSVFNDQAWSLVGKDLVDDTHPQAVTPGLLADVLSDLDGAVWARPRGINLPARTWRVDGGGTPEGL
jgi:hypothetical protein